VEIHCSGPCPRSGFRGRKVFFSRSFAAKIAGGGREARRLTYMDLLACLRQASVAVSAVPNMLPMPRSPASFSAEEMPVNLLSLNESSECFFCMFTQISQDP